MGLQQELANVPVNVHVEEGDLSPGFFCAQAHPAAKGTWLVVARYDVAGQDACGERWTTRCVVVLGSSERLELVFPAQDVHVICDPRSAC